MFGGQQESILIWHILIVCTTATQGTTGNLGTISTCGQTMTITMLSMHSKGTCITNTTFAISMRTMSMIGIGIGSAPPYPLQLCNLRRSRYIKTPFAHLRNVPGG